jgi:hypothetical protein
MSHASTRAGGASCGGTGAGVVGEIDEDAGLPPKLGLVKLILERLLGIRVKISNASDQPKTCPRAQAETPAASDAQGPSRQGWGAEITVEERQFESETTAFAAAGAVKTADGKEISFNLALTMHREYLQEGRVTLRAGDAALDPLVLNFDGTAAQLSDVTFNFDLDRDGQAEALPTLGSGSGFLALDLNGDGKINDGGELFGPQSGDGFADLAPYDGDGNRWIDEADPIYNQLRIWQPGAEGVGTLTTLSQKQVGAIYLGQAETPFAVKNAQNELLGQVVSSGIYLVETGGVGSVQQVDLAV